MNIFSKHFLKDANTPIQPGQLYVKWCSACEGQYPSLVIAIYDKCSTSYVTGCYTIHLCCASCNSMSTEVYVGKSESHKGTRRLI